MNVETIMPFSEDEISNRKCECAHCKQIYLYRELSMLDVGDQYIRQWSLSLRHKTEEPTLPTYKTLQEAHLTLTCHLCEACRTQLNKAILAEKSKI